MTTEVISSDRAPAAIGPYSQAVRAGRLVFLSGQIGLDPQTGAMAVGGLEVEARRALDNLAAVAAAAGGSLGNIAKLTVYLTDLDDYSRLNELMTEYFAAPYPARAVIGVQALPRGASVEIEAILAQ